MRGELTVSDPSFEPNDADPKRRAAILITSGSMPRHTLLGGSSSHNTHGALRPENVSQKEAVVLGSKFCVTEQIYSLSGRNKLTYRDCGMLLDETPLFDPSLLKELDWNSNAVSFSPPISPTNPGDDLELRPLCTADFNKGFFQVLAQLTKTGDVTPEQFVSKFKHMKSTGNYYVVVVEDKNLGQIIATATLIIEHKFIHSCAKRGRVEEVVVSDECRGKQLGKLLVSTLTLLSKKLNCYKITLECAPKNVAFYQKFGYTSSDETYMQCRFFD
ncbi:glucosamine 6-phosphate N-acetyltransferase isoform X1 [Poecilia latipinna]|nr:PREDICTED: glucosamine 6-phosphate N-acetyltransferase isoform X1 [Poecilia latipinna]